MDERKQIENAYEGVSFHKRGEYKWYDTNKVGVVYAEWEDTIKKKAKKITIPTIAMVLYCLFK